MRILFDHGTPVGMRRWLAGHAVITAKTAGWDRLSNGLLLQTAQEAGFDVLVTTDNRIQYQQNLAGRTIAIVVLTGCTKWTQVQAHQETIRAAIDRAVRGDYVEVAIPFD